MSQRRSGYKRIDRDEYETPAWAIDTIEPHIPKRISKIFDPCCGSGRVVAVLNTIEHDCWGKDLKRDGYDFLKDRSWHEAIVTSPPYSLAEEFIVHALTHATFVAMLLRCDYHHAKTRKHLFADCENFSKIVALTQRLVFKKRTDGKKAAPSFNHSWFIWSADHMGPARVEWAP